MKKSRYMFLGLCLLVGLWSAGCEDSGKSCVINLDCDDGSVCLDGKCVEKNPAHCSNGVLDKGEADVDCGGVCPAKCGVGKSCSLATDCATNNCQSGKCAAMPCEDDTVCGIGKCDVDLGYCYACSDGIKNGDETDVDCGGSCGRCALNMVCKSNADCESENCDGGRCGAALPCSAPARGDLVINEIMGRTANEVFQLLPGVQQVQFVEIVNKSDKRIDLSEVTLIIDRRNHDQIDNIALMRDGGPKCLASREALVLTVAPLSGLPAGVYNMASLIARSGTVFSQSAVYDLSLVGGDDVIIDEAEQPTTSSNVNQGVSRTRNPDLSGGFVLHSAVGSSYKASPGFCNNGELFIHGCKAADDHCANGVLDADRGETDVDCGGPCQKCALDKMCRSNADCVSENCASGRCAAPIPCDDPAAGDLVINEILGRVVASEVFQLIPGENQVQFVEIVNKSNKRIDLSKIKFINDRRNSEQINESVLIKDGSPKCLASKEVLVLTAAPISGLPNGAYNVASLVRVSNTVFATTAEYDLSLVFDGDVVIAEAEQLTTSANANQGVSRTRNPDLSGGFVLHSTVGSDYKTSPGYCNNGALFINDCKITGEEHCENNVLDADKGETDVDCGGPCKGCYVGQNCNSNMDCESENCVSGKCAVAISCDEPAAGDLVINEIMGRTANEAFVLLPGVQQVVFVEIVNKSNKRLDLSKTKLISDRRNSTQVNEIVLIKDGSPRCLDAKEVLVLTVAPLSGLPAGVYNVPSLILNSGSVFAQSAEYDLSLVVDDEVIIAVAEQLSTSANANQGVSRTRNPDLDAYSAFVLHNTVSEYKASPGFCSNGALFINDCKAVSDHCSNNVLDTDKGETDIDCGGPCKKCSDGKNCGVAGDCVSGKCTSNVCVAVGCVSNDDCESGLVCSTSGSCVKLTIDGGKTISFNAGSRSILGEVYSANWMAGEHPSGPPSYLVAEIVCAHNAADVLALNLSAWETVASATYTGTRNGNYYQFSGNVPRRANEMYCLLAFSGDDGATFKYATTEGVLKAGSDKLTSASQALSISAYVFKYVVTETFDGLSTDGTVQYGRTTNRTYTVNGAEQTLTALSGRMNWTGNDSGPALVMSGYNTNTSYVLVEGLNAGVGSISFDCGDWSSTTPRKLEITVGSEVKELDLATCVAYTGGSTRKVFGFSNSSATSFRIDAIGPGTAGSTSRCFLDNLMWTSFD
ncbi:MAG: lamin tail domain-containing protein [Proteobacteria bacterium]|nr:lamin tail domain-containing protein [Pseudomonadota bacterium]